MFIGLYISCNSKKSESIVELLKVYILMLGVPQFANDIRFKLKAD